MKVMRSTVQSIRLIRGNTVQDLTDLWGISRIVQFTALQYKREVRRPDVPGTGYCTMRFEAEAVENRTF